MLNPPRTPVTYINQSWLNSVAIIASDKESIQQKILININLLGPNLSAAFPNMYPPIIETTIAKARILWLSAGVRPTSSTR